MSEFKNHLSAEEPADMQAPHLQSVVAQLNEAREDNRPVCIVGGNSRSWYGHVGAGASLSMSDYSGVINYEPTELSVRVRAGTPVRDLNAILAEHHQRLAFEPLYFSDQSSIGGTIATAMAGARRPWGGAVRDHVLGLSLINGKGQFLQFGGQVMKNVAGYDVSRLMVGAMGCLGLICDVSLKVMPCPESERYFFLELSPHELPQNMSRWGREMSPLSGLCHDGERLRVRLEGADALIASFAKRENLQADAEGEAFWQQLRTHQLPWFKHGDPIWRLSMPALSDLRKLSDIECLLDWGGRQAWLHTYDEDKLRLLARELNAQLYAFRGGCKAPFPPLPAVNMVLHQRLKQAYDPDRIFNPGRMYPEL